jgi:hypothetical protein
MLSKESKIRVLENFYALDYIFFGKPVSEMDTCCPLIKEEYLSVKGALMSVFVEMLRLIEHSPETLEEQVDGTALKIQAMDSALIARENSQAIVTTDKAKANIKLALKEAIKENPKANVSSLVEGQIRRKAFSLAVDNLLIARSISEATDPSKLDEWEGRIVEDSYKILRDNLVEAAYMLLYDEDDVVTESENIEEVSTGAGVALGALAGLVVPIPGSMIVGGIAGGLLAKWMKTNKEKIAKFCSAKAKKGSPEYQKCIAMGNQAIKAEVEKAKAKVKK